MPRGARVDGWPARVASTRDKGQPISARSHEWLPKLVDQVHELEEILGIPRQDSVLGSSGSWSKHGQAQHGLAHGGHGGVASHMRPSHAHAQAAARSPKAPPTPTYRPVAWSPSSSSGAAAATARGRGHAGSSQQRKDSRRIASSDSDSDDWHMPVRTPQQQQQAQCGRRQQHSPRSHQRPALLTSDGDSSGCSESRGGGGAAPQPAASAAQILRAGVREAASSPSGVHTAAFVRLRQARPGAERTWQQPEEEVGEAEQQQQQQSHQQQQTHMQQRQQQRQQQQQTQQQQPQPQQQQTQPRVGYRALEAQARRATEVALKSSDESRRTREQLYAAERKAAALHGKLACAEQDLRAAVRDCTTRVDAATGDAVQRVDKQMSERLAQAEAALSAEQQRTLELNATVACLTTRLESGERTAEGSTVAEVAELRKQVAQLQQSEVVLQAAQWRLETELQRAADAQAAAQAAQAAQAAAGVQTMGLW
ncbi:hypothetical protein FOA52_007601 [Chlamydomonas sp. UWO 241]|nr:hypothetical protein FOA52_007601 [Chlamydomonas sp. UWO 241]